MYKYKDTRYDHPKKTKYPTIYLGTFRVKKKKTPQHYNSVMVSRLIVTCQDTYGMRQTKLENKIMICED